MKLFKVCRTTIHGSEVTEVRGDRYFCNPDGSLSIQANFGDVATFAAHAWAYVTVDGAEQKELTP